MKRRAVLTAMLGLPVLGGGECTVTDRFAGRRTVDGLIHRSSGFPQAASTQPA